MHITKPSQIMRKWSQSQSIHVPVDRPKGICRQMPQLWSDWRILRAPVDRFSETCRQMSQTEIPEFCVLAKLSLPVDRWISPVDRCHRPEQPEVCLLQICCNLSTDTQHLSTDAEDLQIRKPSFISKIVFSSPTTLHMKTQLYKHPFEENLVQKQPQPKTLKPSPREKKLLLLCFKSAVQRPKDQLILQYWR